MLQGNLYLSPPLSKWLQTLPITRTSFTNGSIFAHLLAFYLPDSIDLTKIIESHTLDSKRNNFGILDKVCTEFEIDVSRLDWLLVAKGDQTKIEQVLEMIYGFVRGTSLFCEAVFGCLGLDGVEYDSFIERRVIVYVDLNDLDEKLKISQPDIIKMLKNNVQDVDNLLNSFIILFNDSKVDSNSFQVSAKILDFVGEALRETKPMQSGLILRKTKEFKTFTKICESDLEKVPYVVSILFTFIKLDSIVLEEFQGILNHSGYIHLLAAVTNNLGEFNENIIKICVSEATTTLQTPTQTDGMVKASSLHILKSIITDIQDKVLLKDLVTKALTLLPEILNPGCLKAYKYAFIGFLCEIPHSKLDESIVNYVIAALTSILKCCREGQVFVMIAPLLSSFPQLSTAFVESILKTYQNPAAIIELLNIKRVIWQIPFIPDKIIEPILSTWDGFVIIMGISNLLETKRLSSLDLKSITMLKFALNNIPSDIMDKIYLKLHNHIFVTLGVEETSQDGWDLFLIFITNCSSTTIISVILQFLNDRHLMYYWQSWFIHIHW